MDSDRLLSLDRVLIRIRFEWFDRSPTEPFNLASRIFSAARRSGSSMAIRASFSSSGSTLCSTFIQGLAITFFLKLHERSLISVEFSEHSAIFSIDIRYCEKEKPSAIFFREITEPFLNFRQKISISRAFTEHSEMKTPLSNS